MTDTTTAPSTGQVARRIAAPVDVVWSIVSDPTSMHKFSPENVGATVDEPIALGATFEGHNERGGNAWTTSCSVTAHDPPRTFEYRAGDDETGTTWRFDLRAIGGETELVESFDSLRLRHPEWVEQLVGRHAQLVDDMGSTLNAIKAAAEARR